MRAACAENSADCSGVEGLIGCEKGGGWANFSGELSSGGDLGCEGWE